MVKEIMSYIDMCKREGVSLQRGMNYELADDHSVILMSMRPDSPYDDELQNNGLTIIYEGHDAPRSTHQADPKAVDQPEIYPSGKLTQNGHFHKAAEEYKLGMRLPERVRVYEKIKAGIWSYNGVFHLVDSYQENSGSRRVWKFKLQSAE